jgi:rod shape-determining protein MreC
VSSLAGSSASRPGDVADVLRLLALLILSAVLMVLDYRGGWLQRVRLQAEATAQPVWWLAAIPSKLGAQLRENVVSRRMLTEDNARLRQALLLTEARNARLQMVASENERLRGLLESADRERLDVQLASVIDLDLEPTKQRLLLGVGSKMGAEVGQVVIDAGGLMGQVISVTPTTATVLLLTDPDHAVPVMVARSGVRLMLYGTGRSDALRLQDVPLSADVQEGDELLTSGLGGRFPLGFAVGTIGKLRSDDSRAFLEANVIPAAQLDRGRDVLLLRGYKAPLQNEESDNDAPAAAPASVIGPPRQQP